MKKRTANIFWGLMLVAAGIYALAQSLGYEVPQDPVLWTYVFAGISLISFILYFVEGWRNWGALFPGCIFAALALLLGMAARGVESPAMAAPLFIGIAIPFILGYVLDRKQNWWALIPAGVMAFLTLVLFAVDNVPGEWIGSGLFFILAVIFFLVYLGRHATWSIIVAYVMFVLGFMPLLGMTTRPELGGVIFLLAIGLPFLYVYLRYPERWWAIIPAGILLTLVIITAFVLLPGVPDSDSFNRIGNSLFFLGTAATFAIVWLRHHKQWGLWLMILFVILAILNYFFPIAEGYWPVFVIAGGFYLLYRAWKPKEKTE